MKTQCVKHTVTGSFLLACSLYFFAPVLVVHREVDFNLKAEVDNSRYILIQRPKPANFPSQAIHIQVCTTVQHLA